MKRKYIVRNPRGAEQWVVKSSQVCESALMEISDYNGFCRAFVEIRGVLDVVNRIKRGGERYQTLRLRIYGQEDVLSFIMSVLPIKPKKISRLTTYTGSTFMLCPQNKIEVYDTLEYIDGYPKNEKIWEKWNSVLNQL